MRISARWVGPDGVEHTVTTIPWDLVAWERWSGSKMSKLGSDGTGLEDMLRIVHAASRRMGLAGDDFDSWAAGLQEFEPMAGASPTLPDGEPSGG